MADGREETVSLNVDIPKELDKKFRRVLTEKFGGRKGDLQRALIEALEAWTKEPDEETRKLRLMLISSPKDSKRQRIVMDALSQGRLGAMDFLDLAESSSLSDEVKDWALRHWKDMRDEEGRRRFGGPLGPVSEADRPDWDPDG